MVLDVALRAQTARNALVRGGLLATSEAEQVEEALCRFTEWARGHPNAPREEFKGHCDAFVAEATPLLAVRAGKLFFHPGLLTGARQWL